MMMKNLPWKHSLLRSTNRLFVFSLIGCNSVP